MSSRQSNGVSNFVLTKRNIALTNKVKAQNQVSMTINQEAPVIQTKEIIINAAPEKVWQILTHIDAWSKWNKRIKNPTLKGNFRVGNIFTWKTSGSKITSKIHTISSNQMFGWEGKTFGARAIHNWYLEPTKQGTKVRVEESMEGWIINLIKEKMNLKLADDMTYWLGKLKEESEKANTTDNSTDITT